MPVKREGYRMKENGIPAPNAADPMWVGRLRFLEESAPELLASLLESGGLEKDLDRVALQALKAEEKLVKQGLRRDEAQELVLRDVVAAPAEQRQEEGPRRELSPDLQKKLAALKKANGLEE